MNRIQSFLTIGLAIGLTLPTTAWAKSALERRMDQLESQFNNHFNVETLNKIERLEQELSNLRGTLEEQAHELQTLRKRQETLFGDLEHRLESLDQKPAAKQAERKSIQRPPQKKGGGNTTSASASQKKSTATPSKQTAQKAPTSAETEEQAYQAAYGLVQNRQYDQAITALQDFLWKYPNGQLAPNAHYWMGELYLTTWHQDRKNDLALQKAISAFSTIRQRYEKHHKAIDATLKLGLIEMDRENWPAAKEFFMILKTTYPNSSNARIAESKIQKLKQAGKI